MFHGSMVALVTPMRNGEIDLAAFERLLAMHIAAKTDAIVVAGTTGESGTLTEKESLTLIQTAVRYVAHRVPIIAGTGHVGTAQTIEATKAAMESGVDACLLLAPPYVKPTQEGLYLHYRAVASAVPIPQVLYNVPGRTACDLLPETISRLASIANIIGIKEATGDLARAQTILDDCGDKLAVYSGDDAVALKMMHAGAKGVISVTANVVPEAMHEMCAAVLSGDYMFASTLDRRLQSLHRDLFLESNPIPVKWALYLMGLIDNSLRLPLTPLTPHYHKALQRAMLAAGIVLNNEVVSIK